MTYSSSRRLPHFRRARTALAALAVLAAALVAASPALPLTPVTPAASSYDATAPVPAASPAHAPGGVRVVSEKRSGTRVLDLVVASPALGTDVRTRVLLPVGYDAHPHRTWPVLYLLHGCCDPTGGWDDWTRHTDLEALTAGTEALVVMPEGGPVGYYTNWLNGGRGGPPGWETFHLTELRHVLETHLRAGHTRAVAGLSMGGTGALEYAGRHPGFFRSAASFSGRLDTRIDAAAVMRRLVDAGEDPLAMWGDPRADSAVWAAHNPYELVRRLPPGYPVYVSCGNGDPGPLDPPGTKRDALEAQFAGMAEAYVARAERARLKVTASLYGPGTHNWPYWEREFSAALPMLARSIGA